MPPGAGAESGARWTPDGRTFEQTDDLTLVNPAPWPSRLWGSSCDRLLSIPPYLVEELPRLASELSEMSLPETTGP